MLDRIKGRKMRAPRNIAASGKITSAVAKPAKSSLMVCVALGLSVTLSGCLGSLTTLRTIGYDIPEEALVQVQVGTAREVVEFVLGTPQTRNTFGDQDVYYYIETRVEETAFKLRTPIERTVLAVYFDTNNKVEHKAVYTLQDGRVFNTITRRTKSFGTDTNFVSQMLSGLLS